MRDVSVLRGARVLLRGWTPGDAKPFAELNADPIAMEFLPGCLKRAESDALIERLQAGLEARGWGLWCLEVDGECAGFVGLSVPTFEAAFTPCTEIGWRLAPRFWGRGYATEGARLALVFGFQQIRLLEIVSFTTVANQRSRRVMERIGMSRDPHDDFDHPRLPIGHPMRAHVLYRIRSPLATANPSP
jgi:RimJ/RimL family protein N-acetyltransferase